MTEFDLVPEQKLELVKNAIKSLTVQIYNTELEMIANDTENLEVMASLAIRLKNLQSGRDRLLKEIERLGNA